MNIFLEEHAEILSLLLGHQVEFMLIGGYAVIVYGYRRTTGDMDIWLNPTNENKYKFHLALQVAGFEKEGLDQLLALDFTKHLVFSIGEEPRKIDFITRINAVEYADADKHKNVIEIENLKVPVIHLNDLVLSKLNTDRQQDKADVEELQKIQNNKTNFHQK